MAPAPSRCRAHLVGPASDYRQVDRYGHPDCSQALSGHRLANGGVALRSGRGLPITAGRTRVLLHRVGTRLDHKVITRLTGSA